MPRDLSEQLSVSVNRALSFFLTSLSDDGVYTSAPEDIAVYYKHPMMYWLAGNILKADRIMSHIKITYLQSSGDFFPKNTEEDVKSLNRAYQEFYAYTNGWVVRAAYQLERKDIAASALPYLLRYQDNATGGFYTHNIKNQDGVTDVITTAHIGLVSLEAGYKNEAIRAGDYLCETLRLQPNLARGFYLRRGAYGECVTAFDKQAAPMFFIDKAKENQLYFMIAYPIAFLTELYQSTQLQKYLDSAIAYADFALACHPSVFSCELSHKLAWALIKLYEVTEKDYYFDASKCICEYFMAQQDRSGLWYSNDLVKSYDQSAEIVCWFSDIVCTLKNMAEKKKAAADQTSATLFLAK